MTRSQAIEIVADLLMEDSLISYPLADVIITRLDEALHFDPEVRQMEAVCHGVAKAG